MSSHTFSLLLTIDISFSFLAQIFSLLLLQDSTSSLLIFSCLLFSQRHGFTCKTLENLISWLLSNFAISFSLSQISYFFITLFIFIILYFLFFLHLFIHLSLSTIFLFLFLFFLFFPPWFFLFWSLLLFTFFRTPHHLYLSHIPVDLRIVASKPYVMNLRLVRHGSHLKMKVCGVGSDMHRV